MFRNMSNDGNTPPAGIHGTSTASVVHPGNPIQNPLTPLTQR